MTRRRFATFHQLYTIITGRHTLVDFVGAGKAIQAFLFSTKVKAFIAARYDLACMAARSNAVTFELEPSANRRPCLYMISPAIYQLDTVR